MIRIVVDLEPLQQLIESDCGDSNLISAWCDEICKAESDNSVIGLLAAHKVQSATSLRCILREKKPSLELQSWHSAGQDHTPEGELLASQVKAHFAKSLGKVLVIPASGPIAQAYRSVESFRQLNISVFLLALPSQGEVNKKTSNAVQKGDCFDVAEIEIVYSLVEVFKKLSISMSSSKKEEQEGKLKLALVTPFPPEKSGISYYSSELVDYLATYYDVSVVTTAESHGSWNISSRGYEIISISEFMNRSFKFDRVVYQFGNSEFHTHMWDLISWVPGVAVIHDLFVGDALACLEAEGRNNLLAEQLYLSHGYNALRNLVGMEGKRSVIRNYPLSFGLISNADGVIVHSEHAQALARQAYPFIPAQPWAVVPHLRVMHEPIPKHEARVRLGIPDDVKLVCSFGILGPSKLNLELLEAWSRSRASNDSRYKLVYVGEARGEYGSEFLTRISTDRSASNVKVTGWVDADEFRDYLYAADIAVQLRSNSRGESSGTVSDCMAYGLPVICNSHGSFSELPDDAVLKLRDDFDVSELRDALESLLASDELRLDLGKRARAYIAKHCAPERCAALYRDLIESAYDAPVNGLRMKLIRSLCHSRSLGQVDARKVVEAVGKTFKLSRPRKQILVDVSVVAKHDLKTGVERVVRSVLNWLLHNDTREYVVEPVVTAPEGSGYLYAREFALRFLDIQGINLVDQPIDYQEGDVFLGLDLHPGGGVAQHTFIQSMRAEGVKVYFVVHDLLPVTHPHWFNSSDSEGFAKWLSCICQYDGAICVSAATASELSKWIDENVEDGANSKFDIRVVHNGADIEKSAPSAGLPDDYLEVLGRLESVPSFLMVGTVEPRKGHAQVLDAFEVLWRSGHDLNLCIVGKPGWKVESFVERLETHPELGNRLLWLNFISDEYLNLIYGKCACLIAASEAEGFGLPLIEAGQKGIPILARDIPVFREVASSYATYFSARDGKGLAKEIENWTVAYKAGKHISSIGMRFFTWDQSANEYWNILTKSSSPALVKERLIAAR